MRKQTYLASKLLQVQHVICIEIVRSEGALLEENRLQTALGQIRKQFDPSILPHYV